MPKTAYSWLLFDADGTLFDYNYAEENAIKNTFEQSGFTYSLDYLEAYKIINEQIWKDYENGMIQQQELKTKRFTRLFDKLKLDADARLFSGKYLRNLSLCSRLLEGAEEVCGILSGKYSLAIITNGLEEVQRPRYNNSGIKKYFKEIIISDEIGAAKPDKAYFDGVFRKIGSPLKSKVLVIGDSITSDIQGGINYGIDTCWFNPNNNNYDSNLNITHIIRQLKDLISFL
jgi:2-haloacid dehalogenase